MTPSPAPSQPSLSTRLQRLVLTATASALIGSALALLVFETARFRKDGQADLLAQADVLAHSLLPTLQFDDPAAAERTLRSLSAKSEVRIAAVYTPDGRRFASYAAADVGAEELPERGDDLQRFMPLWGAEIALARPVANGQDSPVGTLYLLGRFDLLGRLVAYAAILAVALGTGLMLAALIFRRLHPTLTGPLSDLAAAARRVAVERDYTIDVRASGTREIDDLVLAFNTMVEDLGHEIDERRRAEDGLRLADQRKDEFLALLAHELRNPMAPIMNAVSLLERSQDEGTRDRARDVMKRQLVLMVRLIDDLLEVSRITRGKLELRLATMDLRDAVAAAAEGAAPALATKSQKLPVDLPDQPVWVQADAQRLGQILGNLLNNAAKFTPVKGEIGLRLTPQPRVVRVSVSDNGIGIAAEHLARIFEPFVQVDQSLGRGAAGIGIGLTIARELARLHGGDLTAASAGPGTGTTFTVELPPGAAPHPGSPAAPAAPPAAHGTGGGRTVVVADDNLDYAESFAVLLEGEGHRVTLAHDGRRAVEAIRRVRPDVAFIDIGMPCLSGYDVARAIRAEPELNGTVLVAVTGWGQAADRAKVMAAGFDHHWVKPVDVDTALRFIAGLPP